MLYYRSETNNIHFLIMSNKDRKRKKYQYSLSDSTNDQISSNAATRGMNKSRFIEEAINFYVTNYQSVMPTTIEVDWEYELGEYVMPNTEEVKDVMPTTSEIEIWDLDQLNVMPVDTNSTEYTIQQDNKEMKFRNFAHLMNESEKYEIKGTQTVIKEEYKSEVEVKTGGSRGQLQSMSELITEAQIKGLVLGH